MQRDAMVFPLIIPVLGFQLTVLSSSSFRFIVHTLTFHKEKHLKAKKKTRKKKISQENAETSQDINPEHF